MSSEAQSSEAKERSFTIVVNGRDKVVTEHTLSFDQIVQLAFPSVDNNTIYTVTFSKGEDKKSCAAGRFE